MIADSAARERALDTATSFIVQAPAGSGKTELLIQRYLKLLDIVDSPDSIVAITFTRKAAGEMRARVIQALRKAEAGVAPEIVHERVTYQIARRVLDQDHRLKWNLLQNPAQMRIETIDALCAAITRRMPWLSRFGAMPEISEKAAGLYREAARNTLRHVDEDDEALFYLLLHLDNDFAAAERLIMNMLEKRDQWLRLTGANPDFDAVRAGLEESLETLILGVLRRLRAGFDAEVAAEIAMLREMDRFPEALIEDIERWKIVADLLLTAGGGWRKRVDKNLGFPPGHRLKARVEQLLGRLQKEDALLESLQRFRELPGPRFSDSQWQAMQAAVSVLTLAVAELQMVFRERGRVDFAELAIRASEALGQIESPTDLALALGSRVQHILVDEFQDTSYTQFELIQKLTAGWEPGDGRTLFLVGDPMQSIYRFRQADVGLFLKARREGIGSIQLEPLALSVNFRSRPGIVRWVNETFAGILPAEDDPASGAVAFSKSTAAEESGEDPECVKVHGFLNALDEAKRVVELVKTAGDGKVAVLVRARSHLMEIVGVLKRAGILFQAIEIDQLGERAVIEDLMALTLALLHPADRVSWLAILRAPWCGLELRDLHALAGGDLRATIWDLLHREDSAPSVEGAARIRRILPVLEKAIEERGRGPLRDWVEGVWFRLGGPACVENETALEDAAAYFDLLDEMAEGADIADFDWFREQVNALFAQPDARAGDRLQLMTIHKAKGLEFDTVILPGLGAIPRSEEQRLLLWLEESGALLLAPISEAGQEPDPIYTYLSHVEERKIRRETARLLYVATTRARGKLHLLGTVKTKDDGSIADPPGPSLLKLLWPSLAQGFQNLPHAEMAEEQRAVRNIRRVTIGWKVPPPPEGVEWTGQEKGTIEIPQVSFEWAKQSARHAGTALHGLMQRIAREGLDAWDENAVRSRRSLYQSVLRNLGVPPGELTEAAERVETALLRMLRDPKGRWILGRHSEDECELPITGLVGGKLYETVIDRTFVDENGVRWIIDYKTGSHEGGKLETFLDNEKERYQEQLERYARLLIQRDPRPIRLALYFPLLGGWREWPAPVAMNTQASLFEL
ncbi:MAG TPA: UvrD-helicase domain-containing protein [Bryobacteraceae bacterium]|jgi:ATP-dependent exoDNAse (exonuclease V) beta subunit|nr:UvrD-helicase domain-containing protein [Bryobacteraceae bacterium]